MKKIIHHLGFILEKIPDEHQLFEELDKSHLAVKKHELKRIAKSIRMADNHSLYNRILKKYVPEWENNFTHAEFIGKGRGQSNLDVYRKVYYNDHWYFEKIYFNDSLDLKKMKWFYEHVYPVIKHNVKTSKLHKMIKGNLITIVHFEFVDLVQLQKQEWPIFFHLSKHLYHLSEQTQELCKRAPQAFKNYHLHDEFNQSRRIAEQRIRELSNDRLCPRKIKKVINEGPLIFSHGDIYDTNVFSGNVFIDWDAFGFYPIGFETAIIMSFTHSDSTFKEVNEFLIHEYENMIEGNLWETFMLNCMFFYLVVTASKPLSEVHSNTQKEIVDYIEVLYNDVLKHKTASLAFT